MKNLGVRTLSGIVLGAVVLGLYGVMAGLMLLLWRLCDTENLGVS